MSIAFDSLAYAKALRSAGVPTKQAEAHATAARDYIMAELATKADIADLKHLIERQSLLITVRLGGLVVVAVGALAALLRLT